MSRYRKQYEGVPLPIKKRPSGHWITTGLFSQTCGDYDTSVFSLEDPTEINHRVQPSLKDLYMECNDLTEYKFAMIVFGSWEYFEKVKASKVGVWFKKWNQELRMKMKSKAVEALVLASMEEGSKGIQAAKYIANHEWDKTSVRKTKEINEFEDDAKRIGLKLVNKAKA